MLPALCLLAPTLLLPGDAAVAPAAAPSDAPSDAALAAAADYSAAHRGHALVVLHDGRRVFERYGGGWAADRPHMLASGSKSFVGVAAVAAVQDGLLRLDDPASGGLPAWRDDPLKAAVTYRQLLTLTGGLKPSGPGAATRVPSWEEIAAEPMTGEPGRQFAYGPHPPNVFAYALERLLGDETFEQYLERRIFEPLGVTVEWRYRCADGHPQVGGGAFMTARDWARFGEFVRLGGR